MNSTAMKTVSTVSFDLNVSANDKDYTVLVSPGPLRLRSATGHKITWRIKDAAGKTLQTSRKREASFALPPGEYTIIAAVQRGAGVTTTIHSRRLLLQSKKAPASKRVLLVQDVPHVSPAAATGKKVATKKAVDNGTLIQQRVDARMGDTAPKLGKVASSSESKVKELIVKAKAAKKAPVKKSVLTKPKQTKKPRALDLLAKQIVEFEEDLLKSEGITVKIYPIAGADAKDAIKNTYSHAFSEKLTGKRSAVKQLLARLATIIDPAKAEVRVIDKVGNAVSPGTHLASLRA